MSKQHARHSPSTLEKLTLCSCFKMKDMDDASDEGTLLHKAAETGDLTGLTDEQKQVVQTYLDYITNLKVGFGDKPLYHAHEIKAELKELTFGYADDFLRYGTEAHVADLKTGRKSVSIAEHNFQIQTYCAAMLEATPELESCTGHIVAPRCGNPNSFKFGRDHVAACRAKIEALYERLDDPFERKPTANEDLCYQCARANRCPAIATTALAVANHVGLPLPSAFAPDALVRPEDRAKAELVAVTLENWAEAVRKANKAYVLEAGGTIPGYKTIERSTGRRVPRDNSLSACNALLVSGYASQDQLLGTVTISIPELAKAMVEVRGTKEAVERERLAAILGDLAVEGRTAYLARDTKQVKEDRQLLEM